MRGLYKGLVSPVIGAGMLNAVVFGAYGYSMSLIQPEGGLVKLSSLCLASMSTALVQTPISCVTELVKLRMQVQGIGEMYYSHILHRHNIPSCKTLKGPLETIADIYKMKGVKVLGKGMTVTLCRDVIGYAAYFMSYELLCQQFAGGNGLNNLGPHILAISGGIAGVATWGSCYPLDVIKSRLQTDGIDSEPQYRGMIDCFRKSYQNEGWRVFFVGLNTTLVRAFPVNAVTFCTVTLILRMFKNDNHHSVL